MKTGIKWIQQLLSQHEGKERNPFHYLVEPIYPEYSQIPCIKQGYISSAHLQFCDVYRTFPETGKPSEMYNNCISNMGAQYEQGHIAMSQKQPSHSFCQQFPESTFHFRKQLRSPHHSSQNQFLHLCLPSFSFDLITQS